MKDFELALSELLDSYRNKWDREDVIGSLTRQRTLVTEDDGWVFDGEADDEAEAEADDYTADDEDEDKAEAEVQPEPSPETPAP
jgi:hypothetical protein